MTTKKSQKLSEEIITSLGIQNLPEKKQKEIVNTLEKNIQSKIILFLLETLNEQGQKDLFKILKLSDNKLTMDFIESFIPDAKSFSEKIAKETVEQFKLLAI